MSYGSYPYNPFDRWPGFLRSVAESIDVCGNSLAGTPDTQDSARPVAGFAPPPSASVVLAPQPHPHDQQPIPVHTAQMPEPPAPATAFRPAASAAVTVNVMIPGGNPRWTRTGEPCRVR